MPDIATLILVITIVLIQQPQVIVLLLCPFALSTFCEGKWRKFKFNDLIFAILSVLLITSGVILMLLGIGLTSPIFNNTTHSSLGSINTVVFFNEQNLSDVKTGENILIVNGSNNSKISILNITTTLEPKSPINDFGILGIVLGIVSLGISLIFSGIAYVLTIQKSYEDSKLSAKENFLIAVIWFAFGIIIILYGYTVSELNLSNVIKLIGLIYLIFGLLLGLFYFYVMATEKSFEEVVKKATLDIKSPTPIIFMSFTRIQIAWGVLILGALVMMAGALLMISGFGTFQILLYSVGLAVFLFGSSQVASMKVNTELNGRLDKIEELFKNLKNEK